MLEEFFFTTARGSCPELFLEAMNMSITASYLIIAVLVARLLLKKAPKRICCFLWLLVGIRLVVPVSIESVFSLIPSNRVVEREIMYAAKPEISSGISSVDTVMNQYLQTYYAPEKLTSVNPLQVVAMFASMIWVLGILALLCYFVISWIRLSNKVKTAVPTMVDGIKIYRSDMIESPFLFGVIRPRIYVPFSVETQDLSYVAHHEEAHRKRRDYLIKPIAFLILTLYWFNLMIWVAYIFLCRDIELACDEVVVREFGAECKREYSKALLSCAANRKTICACPVAFGEVGVKARVKNVLNYKKPTFWAILLMIVICIVVPVCFMTQKKEEEVALTDISGRYLMVYEETQDAISLPGLSLYEDGTFTFGYDLLSSYLPYGTYYVEDDNLVMLTSDGRFHYRFKVKDENTLTFQQEYSSDVTCIDERLSAKIEDNALFLKQPGEPVEEFDVIKDTLTEEKLSEGVMLETEDLKEKTIYLEKTIQELEEEAKLIADEPLEESQENLIGRKEELQKEYELIQELLEVDMEKHAFVDQWVLAFCNRDAGAIIEMANGYVEASLEERGLLENGEHPSFGYSSPWPWGSEDGLPNYRVLSIDEQSAVILYYAWTSDPHITVWRENISYEIENGRYVITAETLEVMDGICVTEDFRKAYPEDIITGTMMDYVSYNGVGEALNKNALLSSSRLYQPLFEPDTAAVFLLNMLDNRNKVEPVVMGDKSTGKVDVTFKFHENATAVTVTMLQPYGANGIWLPQSVGKDRDSLLRVCEGTFDLYGILYQSPVEYQKISDSFGRRTHPFSGESTYHGGIDLVAAEGTPVTAAAEGTVYETGFDREFGNYVILLHGNGEMTYYACCEEILVKKGQEVALGEQIATVGNTGKSTGAHLHFAISANGEYRKPEFEEKN